MEFLSGDVRIAYDDEGGGRPIVLVHGFASNRKLNWRSTGWFDVLIDAGFRAVAPDLRGHGQSAKLYDPGDYTPEKMTADVLGLLDHLDIGQADLMGYSMGARLAIELVRRHEDRLGRAVLAGVGENILSDMNGEVIARTLEAEEPQMVDDPTAREFRAFADRQRGDLRALAACMRGYRAPLDREALARTQVPLLFIVGGDDALIGRPQPLQVINPRADLKIVPDRDHMTVIADSRFKKAVMAFLAMDA